MKKIVFDVLLTVLVILGVCAAGAEQTNTFLLYMCGSDIQDAAVEDLYEIADVDCGDAVNIVILAGGASEWDLEDLEGNVLNYMVIRDGYIEELEDWGRASMGSPDTLARFLRHGMTEYPADRYIVILWDHGCGAEGGLCFDETADDDGLTLLEISDALEQARESVPGFHIDIFGCDACMMASYEMAVMLSRYSIDYFVGSEELEPFTGWYYTGWLETLSEDPSVSDEDLCLAMIEAFMENSLANEPDDYLTLSAISLSEIPALQLSMERFAAVLSAQLENGNLSAVRRGRSRLYTFGEFDDGSWDMVDLGAMLDAYAPFDPENAAEAKKALSSAVVASMQTDNLDTCSGLSVMIPQDTTDEFDEYKDGFNLSGFIPNWVGFIHGYAAMLQGGSYHFAAAETTQISEGSGFLESFISALASPQGTWTWNDDAESYEETDTEEITVSDTAQGFTAVLSQEDLEHLDYVEGLLLIDVSDDELECYIDLGSMQNNLINWQTGTVCSLFDGTWPTLDGQIVTMYDQTSNQHSRRSLIPVRLNGEYTYLVVVFPAGESEGRIVGANAGYDDNGLPIRAVTRLQPGDEIIPLYTMYYAEDDEEDLLDTEFEGDPVIWREGMTVVYEDLADDEEPMTMLFCFVFNDIFGNDNMSEMIEFEL